MKREYKNRTEWTEDGLLHREDGAAIEWKSGERHRVDGPAVINRDGLNIISSMTYC